MSYPVLIKPRFPAKRSDKGYEFSVLQNETDVERAISYLADTTQNFVLQDYLKGVELTVDFFCGKNNNLVAVVPGERLKAMSKAFSKNGGAISEGKVFHD